MSARAALISLLREDSALAELGLEKVYAANSVDTPSEDFFAIVSWGATTKAYGTTGSTVGSVWFHDRQRDYGRINDALKRLQELLTVTVHRVGEDGIVLSAVEWTGESGDLYDTGYSTVTRYGDFVAVSRYPSP